MSGRVRNDLTIAEPPKCVPGARDPPAGVPVALCTSLTRCAAVLEQELTLVRCGGARLCSAQHSISAAGLGTVAIHVQHVDDAAQGAGGSGEQGCICPSPAPARQRAQCQRAPLRQPCAAQVRAAALLTQAPRQPESRRQTRGLGATLPWTSAHPKGGGRLTAQQLPLLRAP